MVGENELILFPGTTDVLKFSDRRYNIRTRVAYLMEQLQAIRDKIDTGKWPVSIEKVRIDRELAMALWEVGELTSKHLTESHNGEDWSIVIPNFFILPETSATWNNFWKIPLEIKPRTEFRLYEIIIRGAGEGLLEPFTKKRHLAAVPTMKSPRSSS